MLTSITPLGERGRGNRWTVTMTAYAAGCALGGATTGLVLGAAGSLLPTLSTTVALLLAGAVLLLAALADLLPARLPGGRLPGGRRQVDEDWLARYRGWVYGVGYGFQLGLAVVTVVTSAATYAVLAVLLLTQSAGAGLLLGAVFGLARALPALLMRRVDSPARIRAMAAALQRHAALAACTTAAVLAVGGAVLLTGAAL